MKYQITLLTCWLLASVAAAFGQEVRVVQPFDELRLSGQIRVTLIAADREEVHIDNLRGIEEDDLDITHRGNELRIELFPLFHRKDVEADITVYYRNLTTVNALAGAQVSATAPLGGDKLSLKAGSGAQMEMDITAKVLDATAAEGGQLTLRGVVEQQEVTANTGGVVDGFDLKSGRTYARAGSGGQVQIYVEQYLDARASLGGQITYRGEPVERYTKSMMSGAIDHID